MLVLSRKEDQRILFPNLGIAVQILRVAGNTVRVGIEAPPDVKVLREEVASGVDLAEAADQRRKQRHELRNRLHTAQLALHLVQKQLNAGWFSDAEQSLSQALAEFTNLDELVASLSATFTAGGSTPTADRRPNRRALLVEDNAHERELLAAYLRLSGYEVDTAKDGLDAMRYLADHERPDVVLLDMEMPRLNGSKTISAIRCNPAFRGLKLVAVSGTDRNSLGIPLGNRGVDRWFSKPLDPVKFVDALEHEFHDPCTTA